jgi:choline dehydrogenase-like flavoprotein
VSGGWAAKELTEKGLKVLMIERGRNIEHVKDYVNANKEIWEFPHRNTPTRQMKQDFPVLRRDYPLNESTLGMWANEQENPYTEIKRMDWYRAYQVGGRSLLWGRQSYRWNKWDFEANLKEGIAVDWPIRYEDLAPWYSYVERFAGIQGTKEGLEVLPDGEFMPGMEMNVVEKFVAEKIKSQYNGKRRMFIGRSANITVPHNNRVNCQYRDRCWRGCPFGAYFSTQSATLPAANATGNLTLEVNKIVTRILYNKDKKRATGVEVLDTETNKTYTFDARLVFVCASTFNSTWILMNSATDIWPEGLGSSSGELGRNIMDHHFKIGAQGEVEGFEDKYVYGRRPTGIYIPRFRNVYDDKRDYLRGFGYQGGGGRGRQGLEQVAEFTLGAELKNALSEPGPWGMSLLSFGEMLPYRENRMTLDKSRKDKWGLPVIAFDVEMKENERKMRKDMVDDAVEMLTRAGVKNVRAFDWGYHMGMGIHEMGTARMGRDPKTSVLNGNNQVWDAPNVFVTDGACMTSASCVNPSLTYMALTARAADFAVKELRKGNI